jgi:hypothetical protein
VHEECVSLTPIADINPLAKVRFNLARIKKTKNHVKLDLGTAPDGCQDHLRIYK